MKIDMDELDITSSESKTIYEKIKKNIADKYDAKVTNLYITQVKNKHGVIECENNNKVMFEDSKQPKSHLKKRRRVRMHLSILRSFSFN